MRLFVTNTSSRSSFDHMLGLKAKTNPAINGCFPMHKFTNPLNPADPSSPLVSVDNEAVFIQPADPDHEIPAVHEQIYGANPNPTPDPTVMPPMNGFISNCVYFLSHPRDILGL